MSIYGPESEDRKEARMFWELTGHLASRPEVAAVLLKSLDKSAHADVANVLRERIAAARGDAVPTERVDSEWQWLVS